MTVVEADGEMKGGWVGGSISIPKQKQVPPLPLHFVKGPVGMTNVEL